MIQKLSGLLLGSRPTMFNGRPKLKTQFQLGFTKHNSITLKNNNSLSEKTLSVSGFVANKKLQMKGNKNEIAVAVVEEPVNIWKTIKLWEHRLVRMCSFQLQIFLIFGLVKGAFGSTGMMLRALVLQLLILLYVGSLSNQRAARNGDLFYVVSTLLGFGCLFYMIAKLFSLVDE